MREKENLKVGRPDVDPEKPAHTRGVPEGNATGNYEKMRGHHPDGTSDARRSTGINPEQRDTIVPGSPNLSPP
jgi:hypothetical protein